MRETIVLTPASVAEEPCGDPATVESSIPRVGATTADSKVDRLSFGDKASGYDRPWIFPIHPTQYLVLQRDCPLAASKLLRDFLPTLREMVGLEIFSLVANNVSNYGMVMFPVRLYPCGSSEIMSCKAWLTKMTSKSSFNSDSGMIRNKLRWVVGGVNNCISWTRCSACLHCLSNFETLAGYCSLLTDL